MQFQPQINHCIMNYIAYYRVSTAKQGSSGLGLESQKTIVENYIQHNGKLIAEFKEIESGKNNNRPELLNAIATAKQCDATLVIAKLDRLSRNLAFIATLMETRVNFIACDCPTATPLTLHIFGAMAEFERQMISTRTINALQAKKKREPNWKPGTPVNLSLDAMKKGHETISKNAKMDQSVIYAYHYICLLKEQGLSYQQIACKLNSEGYKTRTGCSFHAIQAWTIMKRFAENQGGNETEA
jgi:DNA invertase Pin-like site-specific DNA recombinase